MLLYAPPFPLQEKKEDYKEWIFHKSEVPFVLK
jgi:hypothetical protein